MYAYESGVKLFQAVKGAVNSVAGHIFLGREHLKGKNALALAK